MITDNDKRTGPPVTINDVYYTHIIWLQHALAGRGHHQVIQENKNTQKGDISFCLIMSMFEKCKKMPHSAFYSSCTHKNKRHRPCNSHSTSISSIKILIQHKSFSTHQVSLPFTLIPHFNII